MMPSPTMELEADIRTALRDVIDPELGHNIIDLGLVYDIDVGTGGAVTVLLTTTARFCPASAFLTKAVAARAGSVRGVSRIDVQLTYDPPWSPDFMAPEMALRF